MVEKFGSDIKTDDIQSAGCETERKRARTRTKVQRVSLARCERVLFRYLCDSSSAFCCVVHIALR